MLFETRLPSVSQGAKSSKRQIFENYKNLKKKKYWVMKKPGKNEKSV